MLNFSIKELCYSKIAIKENINNSPNIKVCDNLLNLIYYCLQPLREKLGKPIIITSGFRCEKLNSHPKINGVVNSQHLFGQAADIKVNGAKPDILVNWIDKTNIPYDQLINEYNKWVHISFAKGNYFCLSFTVTGISLIDFGSIVFAMGTAITCPVTSYLSRIL